MDSLLECIDKEGNYVKKLVFVEIYYCFIINLLKYTIVLSLIYGLTDVLL